MIYLIDDKRRRQANEYGWSESKFEKAKSCIKPIYTIEELTQISEEIFKVGNTVIYHESFLDNSNYSKEALDKRKKLELFAENNLEFKLVLFSGSKSNRSLNSNIAHLPVSTLYQNLDSFISKFQEGRWDLNYLLFGDNPEIENQLNIKLNKALSILENQPAIILDKRNLFIRPVKGNIQNPIEGCVEKTLFNKDISDTKLLEYIDDWLEEDIFDNIFIPLCFGGTLSDFNGLRLATFIRCTDTKNQLSNIFIYGFVGFEYLLDHECFNILKTKNVTLVPFQKSAFQKEAEKVKEVLTLDELPNEVQKLNLNVPKDYDDNHALNNEWAIYKWNLTLPNPVYDRIEKVLDNIDNRLYFKYLQTIYPSAKYLGLQMEELELLKDCKGRILLVDNDYRKGWLDLFNTIIPVKNPNLVLEALEINFKALDRDEIITKACNKVINPDTGEINYDVVILDYRLHNSDNDEVQIDKISGLQILKKIKALNPGIQVIMFSATNKIWNLQKLQQAGADGFVIKEGAENSVDYKFTRDTISYLVQNLRRSLRSKFLIEFFQDFNQLQKELMPRTNLKKASDPLPKEFVNEVLKWLEFSYRTLLGTIDESDRVASFLMLFSVLENLATRVIDTDNPKKERTSSSESHFEFEYRMEAKKLKEYKENTDGVFYCTNKILKTKSPSIPWKQKILNTMNFIGGNIRDQKKLSELVRKRNDIIHANSTSGEKVAVDLHLILFLNSIIISGLRKVR